MKKILIFGAGSTGQNALNGLKSRANIVGFLDNDSAKKGTQIAGVPVIGDAGSLKDIEYDEILVCSLTGAEEIKRQLILAGVPPEKINCEYVSTQINARLNFLRDFAALHEDVGTEYSVAEGGVFRGEFAKEINRCFPTRKMILFDTFEGFDKRDIQTEHEKGYSRFLDKHLNNTGVDLVLKKLPYPEMVEIRKGYFPDTLDGLDNQRFLFVNLDFDLFNPTLSGLRYFYPRLHENGVILIHDYYNPAYMGINEAIESYENEVGCKLLKMPIGDHCSIAVLKQKSF